MGCAVRIGFPITLLLIFGLPYLNTKSSLKAGIVMPVVPFWAVFVASLGLLPIMWSTGTGAVVMG